MGIDLYMVLWCGGFFEVFDWGELDLDEFIGEVLLDMYVYL